jgi:hypothetical protein
MIQKFGKKINMRALKRDLTKICEMIDKDKCFSKENIVPYDPSGKYFCRICFSKEYTEFTIVNGYHYALCKKCGSIVLLNIPDVKRLYNSECSIASDIYLDDEVFHQRVQDIAMPKLQFILECITPPTHTHLHTQPNIYN